jgi:chromodomain-helicase-DNA-binding protein 4
VRKQTAGELAPFDPGAHYVHPKSRVRMVMNIGKKGARLNISSAGSVPPSSEIDEVPDSEAETDEGDAEDEDGEYGEDDDSPVKVRRSTRSTKKLLPRQNLPFSPKKTRSQKIIVLDTDEEDEADEGSHVPTRRSTRSRNFKVKLDEGTYYESEQEDASEDSAPRLKSAAKRAKVARKKGVRPAYGHVRTVADLDYDANSDEDTAALRVHRSTCEKCLEKPTHELLAAERRRPKGKGRRKRKTSEDEFEESGDEIERINKKGGWVRWLVQSFFLFSPMLTGIFSLKCPVVNHWSCLSSVQRDEILKAARDVDRAAWRSTQPESELRDENGKPKANVNGPAKRPGLDAQQTTDFVCGT